MTFRHRCYHGLLALLFLKVIRDDKTDAVFHLQSSGPGDSDEDDN